VTSAPSPQPRLAPTPPVVAPATKEDARPSTGWWSGERTAGVIAGSVGLVAIGVGTALCVTGGDSKSGSSVSPQLALGGISLASGGVLLLSGLVLLATAPKDEAPQHAYLTVAPTLLVAHSATMLGAVGEF
jgi:hypothetical protein